MVEQWINEYTIPGALNSLSFVAALCAALFWYRSAKVEVPYQEQVPDEGYGSAAILVETEAGELIDHVRTAQLANEWNARAALSAFFAALSQAVAYFYAAFNALA